MSIGVVNSQFTPQSKIYLLKGLEIDAMNNTFWGAFNNTEEQFNFSLIIMIILNLKITRIKEKMVR